MKQKQPRVNTRTAAGRWHGPASAGRKARVEVKLKELTQAETALFREAKHEELTSWVKANAIRKILRERLNPEQIRVLTWKYPDPKNTRVRKAKARLVVLGYQDSRLTEVSRDSPTRRRDEQ